MSDTYRREPRVKVGIALRRDQHETLRMLAASEKHGNVSLIVQRAIDREIDRAHAAFKAVAEGRAA